MDERDAEGRLPIHHAVAYDRLDAVKTLVALGTDSALDEVDGEARDALAVSKKFEAERVRTYVQSCAPYPPMPPRCLRR